MTRDLRIIASSHLRHPVAMVALGVALVAIVATALARGPQPGSAWEVALGRSAGGLEMAGHVLLVICALAMAVPRATGVERELFLSGFSIARQRLAALAVLLLACLAVVVCAVGLVAVLETTVLPATSAGASVDAPLDAIRIMAGVLLFVTVGCALGASSSSTATAATLSLSLVALSLAATLTGQFPASLAVKAIVPSGAYFAMGTDLAGIRGNNLIEWGIPAVLVAVGLAITLRAQPPGAHGAATPGADRPPRAGARRASSALALAVPVAGCLVFGAVAPGALRSTLPWWLKAQWLSDVARGRDSAPVGRRFVAAVAHGDRRAVVRLTAPGSTARAGGLLTRRIADSVALSAPRYVYLPAAPGSTTTRMRQRDGAGWDLTVCFTRGPRGWAVTSISSSGLC